MRRDKQRNLPGEDAAVDVVVIGVSGVVRPLKHNF